LTAKRHRSGLTTLFKMINKKRLISLTEKLIRVDSQNPGSDESAIAAFAAGYLKKMGLRPRIYEFKEKRSNLIAVLPARNSRHSLLITPHLDTVPKGKNWSFNPFMAKISAGRIYGLGATDCKGNVAAAIEAVNSLIEEKAALNYNLIFAATADEECGSLLGLIPLLRKGILKADAALVLDSDDFKIIVSQKGLLHLRVKISGKRAHGACPWRGVNAISIAVEILTQLKKKKLSSSYNSLLHPATVNIGTIRGGDKVNIVADWCEFELDFRFLPGGTALKFIADLKKIIRKSTDSFKLEIEDLQKPYQISRDHPLVAQLSGAMKRLGMARRICGSEGATTITFFAQKGIPAIATGFGSSGCCHTADEYIKIDTLFNGARVLEEFLKTYRFKD